MKRVSSPKNKQRQQQENQILRDMALIRENLSDECKEMAADALGHRSINVQKAPNTKDDLDVDKGHVMSVISHFTALKRAVKF